MNLVVGPAVMIIGIGALVTAIVLSVVLETAGFLALLIPAALALGGGAFILRGARRSRLEITADGFVWGGFIGAEHTLRWDQVHRILPAPPGASRVAALAPLRDGSTTEVRALWVPPTSPLSLMGGVNHREDYQALVNAHRQWLATPHHRPAAAPPRRTPGPAGPAHHGPQPPRSRGGQGHR